MLIVTGSLAYDYIMDFPGNFGDHILPDQIHKINLSFIVNKFAKRRGGTAGNVSYTLGLLATPNILFSVAGKDFSEYRESLEKLPINMNHIVIDTKEYTATGFAMTDKTDNQIWGFFYGAAEATYKLQLKEVATTKDLVLVGPAGARGSLSMIQQCVEEKIPYMFDPGFILTQITDADLVFGVTHAKYIIGNDYEVDLIKSRIATWKQLFADKIIVTTLGEKGARIEQAGTIVTIPSVPTKKMVDPTGAGDAWRGGFLAGVVQGLDLQTCGMMGSLAAVYAVEQYGTQEHTYTKEAFGKRYRQVFGSMLTL